MGCFSFLCNICGKSIKSDSSNGQHCTLFLLRQGVVIESMTGQYDSYGRVFNANQDSTDWSHPWPTVCTLMHNNSFADGIAAVHTRCNFKNYTTALQSDPDPDQGEGRFTPTKLTYVAHRISQYKFKGHIGCKPPDPDQDLIDRIRTKLKARG